MDLSSWFRRKLLSKNSTTQTPNQSSKTQSSKLQQSENEELLGITEQLIEFVKTLTLDTFKNFPLQDFEGTLDEGPTTSKHVSEDLSEWQTRHATVMLSRVQEIAQLRYKLCPRQFKEQQFWRIYFALVKNYVAEYELRAIRLEKLRKMASNEEKSSETSSYEIEMAETKHPTDLSHSTP